MNLQPLYDLKERLDYTAIAGTALLAEDFRLKRAVDGMATLASANPVFKKIHQSASALFAAAESERGALLLDVLSLVDAVVYTQGVTHLPGEQKPLEQSVSTYIQIPYSTLAPLFSALSSTGSGRYAVIRDNWELHPEYFTDFRVQPLLVPALSDGAADLPHLVGTILSQQGREVIPMLKEGFDPEGKSDMIRRVELIASIAGADENDWFLSILPDSKRFVRVAVIHALGECQDNTDVLITLCQTEKGKVKEAALRSLARMETQKAIEFWKWEVEKNSNYLSVLEGISQPFAADLAADAVKRCLEGILANDDLSGANMIRLQDQIYCLYGKYSEKACELWHWAADRLELLTSVSTDAIIWKADYSPAEHLQRAMLITILWNPIPEVLNLARELSKKNREWFGCCGILADLLTMSPEAFYNTYARCISPVNLLQFETHTAEQNRIQFMRALSPLYWDEKKGCHCLRFSGPDERCTIVPDRKLLLPGIDPRWVIRLSNHNIPQSGHVYDFNALQFRSMREISLESILMQMITPTDPESCRVCGEYFYRRVKLTGQLEAYRDTLIRCGWSQWSGLLTHCIQKRNQVAFYSITHQLKKLPVTNRERAKELRQIHELVQTGRVSTWNRIWPEEQILHLIDRLEADPEAEI